MACSVLQCVRHCAKPKSRADANLSRSSCAFATKLSRSSRFIISPWGVSRGTLATALSSSGNGALGYTEVPWGKFTETSVLGGGHVPRARPLPERLGHWDGHTDPGSQESGARGPSGLNALPVSHSVTQGQAESGGMVLVANAGPVRSAHALCDSALCLPTNIHSLLVNKPSSSSSSLLSFE